jgi:PAS domain S-box-containing protein
VRSEQLIGQLHELRTRAKRFHQRATTTPGRPEGLLDEALAELGVALEELRVTEDELRSQNDRLVGGAADAQDRLRQADDRFEWAPDAMFETTSNGVIQAANRAAGDLLGVRFDLLSGKPMATFVPLEDRQAFRLSLRKLVRAAGTVEDWTIRVSRRSGAPRLVDVSARAIVRGGAGTVVWSLRPRKPTEPDTTDSALTDDVLAGDAELALRSIVGAAKALCPAAGAGVMLADPHGAPRWVTATDPLAKAFEDAQATLGRGPCIDVLLLRTTTDLHKQQTLAEQLQQALHRRVLIEQAKGVLMARHGIDQDEAWTRLRQAARITRRKAVDLAAEIVNGRTLPTPDG